jgi:hypothetical protein
MIDPDKTDLLSTLVLLAASGLSLGMSVTVLGDIMPWRWADRHPWIVASILVVLWLPFALSGDQEIQKAGATAVSLYLAGLFVAYDRRVRTLARAAEVRAAAPAVAPASPATEYTCSVRLRGNCVPAPRIPVDDKIGEDPS